MGRRSGKYRVVLRLALANGDVGQVLRRDPGQRRQVRGLLVGGPEPHEIGILDDGVEHHQALDGVVQRDAVFAARLSASPMAA